MSWSGSAFILMGIYFVMQWNEKCFAMNQLHDAAKWLVDRTPLLERLQKKGRRCSNLKWCPYSVTAHHSFLFIPEVFILYLFSQTNLSFKAAITSSKANWKRGRRKTSGGQIWNDKGGSVSQPRRFWGISFKLCMQESFVIRLCAAKLFCY